ncbi:MAG: porin family protein [Bacteroidota bacterium]
MKKFFLCISLFVFTITASAQSFFDDVGIGVRGGLNLSTITGDDFDSPDSRTSFYIGILAEFPLSEKFSLQSELFYSAQGFDIGDEPLPDGSDAIYDATLKLDYIQIPILMKVYLAKGLNLHGGPQFGFNVNEEISIDIPGDDDLDIELDDANSFDFQITNGLEYKIKDVFLIQARYTFGLTDIIDDVDSRTSNISFGIGYIF